MFAHLRLASLLLVCGTALASGAPAAARDTSYNDTKGEGKALVQDLLTRMPPENSQILGLLKIRPLDESILEIPVRMTVRLMNDGWHEVYETQPVGERPGEVFIVKHRGAATNEYLFGQYKKVEDKPDLKVIGPDDLYRPLAGSDFFLVDLGLEFLHWPDQKNCEEGNAAEPVVPRGGKHQSESRAGTLLTGAFVDRLRNQRDYPCRSLRR